MKSETLKAFHAGVKIEIDSKIDLYAEEKKVKKHGNNIIWLDHDIEFEHKRYISRLHGMTNDQFVKYVQLGKGKV